MRAASAIQNHAPRVQRGVSISAVHVNPVSKWRGRHAPWPIRDQLVQYSAGRPCVRLASRIGWLLLSFSQLSRLQQRRGERATTWLRRALSEAGEGTVLARPEAQLPGRARAVVLVANDEAKRPSGSQPRHLPMPSMNPTSRVRPVRSLAGFGRGAQRGC